MRSLFIAGFVALIAVPGFADEKSDLGPNLKGAKVSLEKGIVASKTKGKPISAKYEMEDGKLQLSVYTAKGDSFSEVIVDHKTGKVAKAEPITSGDDLTAAKSQNETMSKAKTSLDAAVAKAVRSNKGFKAVSALPSLKDGHPSADVTLMKGTESKLVTEKLD